MYFCTNYCFLPKALSDFTVVVIFCTEMTILKHVTDFLFFLYCYQFGKMYFYQLLLFTKKQIIFCPQILNSCEFVLNLVIVTKWLK